MRKPEDKYLDLLGRGRSVEQIRAIAAARDDKELIEYLKTADRELEELLK